jgi:hypothetical protein
MSLIKVNIKQDCRDRPVFCGVLPRGLGLSTEPATSGGIRAQFRAACLQAGLAGIGNAAYLGLYVLRRGTATRCIHSPGTP